MRFKLSAGLLSLSATVCLVASPFAQGSAPRPAQEEQQDGQDVTESFMNTRGAGFGDRAKKQPAPGASSGASSGMSSSKATSAATPSKKQPKTGKLAKQGKNSGKTDAAPKGMTDAAPNQVNAAVKTAPDNAPKSMTAQGNTSTAHHGVNTGDGPRADGAGAASPAGAVGLGYTILMVGDDGSNMVVEPSRAFVAGDRVRIALETNADGYIYIINAENDRPDPVMLYPHAAIDGGANKIAAHARDFFPADLRYSFVFDETAATEHLYVIFSRRPLADVPTGAALVEYCGSQKPDECFWQPKPEQWARIKAAAAQGRVVEGQNKDLAATKTQLPAATLSRGIKVKKDEPAPAVVRMNASAESDMLLTRIRLVHK